MIEEPTFNKSFQKKKNFLGTFTRRRTWGFNNEMVYSRTRTQDIHTCGHSLYIYIYIYIYGVSEKLILFCNIIIWPILVQTIYNFYSLCWNNSKFNALFYSFNFPRWKYLFIEKRKVVQTLGINFWVVSTHDVKIMISIYQTHTPLCISQNISRFFNQPNEYMGFNQTSDISTLDGTSLKLVIHLPRKQCLINRKRHRHAANEGMDCYR